ncbi:DUF1404 domain-containing protein [Acidianus sulfidivorans JP7]|uniref:DUF1404 domain-containing protein n=1 Tax=Acidianus sulfidivorans JP7 TaxID=619593 RepID=A0A2U9IQM5_9CREN|nr:DUF1404 domain-containing protein [Acidianus sulfidivorans]AWR98284.1 DUF1404 domain-containing protein [Acidianus sulfidivorans JP7]
MQVLRDKLTKKNLAIPIAFLIIAINPFTELLEPTYEALYMAMHYVLYIGGFLLGYEAFKGSRLYLIPGIIIPVFWHIPLFFNIGAAYLGIRILEDLSLYFGGLLAGSTLWNLNNASKVILFVLWMMGDSVLSVILIVGWPPYSNQVYSFSPFTESEELITGLTMFGIMTVIFIYIVTKMLRSIFKI